ncbi:MAG TPA: hypothetical protein VEJ88_09240 [Dissulfurispiraceae bacterium]|nr:hypothetical protein [Dissulfurispiraceae bacterium]
MIDAKKRQGIIVGIMALVILYGLYTVIASKARLTSPNAANRATELQSFVTQTTATVGSEMPSAYDMYVASRAGSPWGNNPFYRKGENIGSRDLGSMRSLFIYAGYIETGGRRVAVINDADYMAGEPLEKEGFYLKKISPSSVLIENRRDKTMFEIPISE